MYGDYESLRDGSISDCLMDLTGGIPEHYPLHELVTYKNPDTRRGVYTAIYSALEANSLVTLSIRARKQGDVRALTQFGLIVGRAYMVLSAKVCPSLHRYCIIAAALLVCLRVPRSIMDHKQ